jgi:hypothetical protein
MCTLALISELVLGTDHKVHRVAMAIFWRALHHEGKISPGWLLGGGFTISTITFKVVVYAPAERADALPYFSPNPICTLWYKLKLWIHQ